MDPKTTKAFPQSQAEQDHDRNHDLPGEIFSPDGWQPFERRRFLSRSLTLIFGSVAGYAAYPWLIGERRQELVSQLQQQWDTLNAPRKRQPWRHELESNDLREDRAVASASTSTRPIVLDQEGLAYQSYLLSLNLRYIKPIELLRPHFKCIGHIHNHLPPRELWQNIAPTLKIADALREMLGVPLVSINSAFRSPAYNSACVGAATNSCHTRNLALDLVYACPPGEVVKAAQALRSQGKFKGGIGRYRSFTHIDTRGINADWGSVGPKLANR